MAVDSWASGHAQWVRSRIKTCNSYTLCPVRFLDDVPVCSSKVPGNMFPNFHTLCSHASNEYVMSYSYPNIICANLVIVSH